MYVGMESEPTVTDVEGFHSIISGTMQFCTFQFSLEHFWMDEQYDLECTRRECAELQVFSIPAEPWLTAASRVDCKGKHL